MSRLLAVAALVLLVASISARSVGAQSVEGRFTAENNAWSTPFH